MNDFLRDLMHLGKRLVEASEAIQSELDKRSPIDRPRQVRTSASSNSATVGATTSSSSSRIHISDLYARHLLNGCPDPLNLLTVAEAEEFLDCVIDPCTTGESEYIGVHYGCADERSMYVSLSVSAQMPWDYVAEEVSTQPAPKAVGEEALTSGDMLYVRQGEHFFWIYGRNVEQTTIYSIAQHVANRLSD